MGSMHHHSSPATGSRLPHAAFIAEGRRKGATGAETRPVTAAPTCVFCRVTHPIYFRTQMSPNQGCPTSTATPFFSSAHRPRVVKEANAGVCCLRCVQGTGIQGVHLRYICEPLHRPRHPLSSTPTPRFPMYSMPANSICMKRRPKTPSAQHKSAPVPRTGCRT